MPIVASTHANTHTHTKKDCKVFKPEYILDNVAAFGIDGTIGLIEKKFVRMGKSKRMARIMAHTLVQNTLGSRVTNLDCLIRILAQELLVC